MISPALAAHLAHDENEVLVAHPVKTQTGGLSPVVIALGLTGIAFTYGFCKAAYVRKRLEAKGQDPAKAAPMSATSPLFDVLGSALEEEIEFRAGANRVVGPFLGNILFAGVHYDEKSSVALNSLRLVDVLLGGVLYEAAFSAARGTPAGGGLSALAGIARGLAASTAAHTAHNLGLRLALKK